MLSFAWRIPLFPLVLAFSLLLIPLCLPYEVLTIYGVLRGKSFKSQREEAYNTGGECGGGCGEDCGQLPCIIPTWYISHGIRRNDRLMQSLPKSETPALEAASWVQFLMNYQIAWWGYASIRWEWRLASMIPAEDMYGAFAETTVADLELLSLVGGMHFLDDKRVLARTNSGEQLGYSEHPTLGLVASYRSGRENIQPGIFLSSPKKKKKISLGYITVLKLHEDGTRRLCSLTRNTEVDKWIYRNPIRRTRI